MKTEPKKICLNCRGNWDECEGHKCICPEAVCCDSNLSTKDAGGEKTCSECYAFGYILSED